MHPAYDGTQFEWLNQEGLIGASPAQSLCGRSATSERQAAAVADTSQRKAHRVTSSSSSWQYEQPLDGGLGLLAPSSDDMPWDLPIKRTLSNDHGSRRYSSGELGARRSSNGEEDFNFLREVLREAGDALPPTLVASPPAELGSTADMTTAPIPAWWSPRQNHPPLSSPFAKSAIIKADLRKPASGSRVPSYFSGGNNDISRASSMSGDVRRAPQAKDDMVIPTGTWRSDATFREGLLDKVGARQATSVVGPPEAIHEISTSDSIVTIASDGGGSSCPSDGFETQSVNDGGDACIKKRKRPVGGGRRCKHDGCSRHSHFGFTRQEYCSRHKLPGMFNVKGRRCSDAECTRSPVFGKPGDPLPTFCRAHKLVGMVDIKNPSCREPTCPLQPSFGCPQDRRSRYCATHRLPGMVNIRRMLSVNKLRQLPPGTPLEQCNRPGKGFVSSAGRGHGSTQTNSGVIR